MTVIRAVVSAALLASLCGCAFTLSDINTGVTAGRTFEDGSVFASGKTAWSATISGHFTRDKR